MVVLMKYNLLLAVISLSPVLALAQEGYNIQTFIINLGAFLNDVVMPFILAVAFFIFVFNAIRFFVIQSTTEEGRNNAKNLAIYSIGAFVFLLSFWGLVNIVVSGVGLGNSGPITPDYMREGGTGTDFQNIWQDTDPFGGIPGDPWGGVDPFGGL